MLFKLLLNTYLTNNLEKHYKEALCSLAIDEPKSDDGFTTVTRRRIRSNIRPLRGTSNTQDNQTFVAATSNKMWFYVGKASQSVNQEVVLTYISDKLSLSCAEDLVIEKLKTLGNSFKIGIIPQHYDVMNSCGFWPSGIIFRRFNF